MPCFMEFEDLTHGRRIDAVAGTKRTLKGLYNQEATTGVGDIPEGL